MVWCARVAVRSPSASWLAAPSGMSGMSTATWSTSRAYARIAWSDGDSSPAPPRSTSRTSVLRTWARDRFRLS
jgi:hypothetical protein